MGKRILIALRSAVLVPLCAKAQSMDGLMEKYAFRKAVVTVTMPESILKKMAKRDDNDLLRKLTLIKVISITASESDSLRTSFMEDAGHLTAGYEMLYSVSNGDRWTSAYFSENGKEALTLSVSPESVTLLYMAGNIDDQIQDALLNNRIQITE